MCALQAIIPSAALSAIPGYVITSVTPPDFSAVSLPQGNDCSIGLAKMNHAGWDTEFFTTDVVILDADSATSDAGPTLASASTYYFKKR